MGVLDAGPRVQCSSEGTGQGTTACDSEMREAGAEITQRCLYGGRPKRWREIWRLTPGGAYGY